MRRKRTAKALSFFAVRIAARHSKPLLFFFAQAPFASARRKEFLLESRRCAVQHARTAVRCGRVRAIQKFRSSHRHGRASGSILILRKLDDRRDVYICRMSSNIRTAEYLRSALSLSFSAALSSNYRRLQR